MAGRTYPHRQDYISACPRCGSDVSQAENACTNPKCSWPDPEPGIINTVRYALAGAADAYLQKLREKGQWPPPP